LKPAGVIADALETARLERLYRRLLAELRRERGGAVWSWLISQTLFRSFAFAFTWGLPLLGCLMAFDKVQAHGTKWLLVSIFTAFQPLDRAGRRIYRFNEFEALRLPSREGMVCLRWARALPWLLWLGLSWSLVLSAKIEAFGGRLTTPIWGFLAAAVLGPSLLAASSGISEAVEEEKPRAGKLSLQALDFIRASRGLFAITLLHPADLAIQPPAWLTAWIPWLGPPTLLLCLWSALGMFRLQAQAIRRKAVVHPFWLGGPLPGDRSPEKRRKKPRPVPIRPSRFLAKKGGLCRAQVYLSWLEFRPLLGCGAPLLFLGYILAAAAVWLAGDGLSGLALPAAGAFIATRLIGIGGITSDSNAWLHLLGIDYREQVLHDLKSLFLVAAPLLILTALGTGLALGFTEARWGVVALLSGFLLLRAGFRGLPGIPETSALPQLFAILLVGALLFAPRLPPAALFTVAATTGLAGLACLARRLQVLDEGELRRLVRQEETNDPFKRAAGVRFAAARRGAPPPS